MRQRPEYDAYVSTRSPRLLRTAYLLTRDWAAAEDLLQTALVKLWFAWRRVHGDPDAYVRKILATTFVSWRRRRWTGEIATERPPDIEYTLDGTREHAERDAVWRLLGRLPRRQRAVLVLRYFEDLSVEDTAAALGISTGAVKSQASRALSRLREVITEVVHAG